MQPFIYLFFKFLLLKRQLCFQRLIKYGSKTTVDTSTVLKSKISKFLQLEIQILFMGIKKKNKRSHSSFHSCV